MALQHLHRGKAESAREYDVAEMAGPFAWGILHQVVESFPCSPCAEHGGALLRGLHDVVNVRLGKELYEPKAFWALVEEVQNAAAAVGSTRLKVERADRSIEQTVARLAQEAGLLAASPSGKAASRAKYPQCSTDAKSKWERCIRAVKGQPHVRSPYAVCTASVGCSPRRKE